MTTPLTDKESLERLEAIKARVEKATKGPWKVDPDVDRMRRQAGHEFNGSYVRSITARGTIIAQAHATQYTDLTQRERNARFIAHSRADVEFLLALIESSREREAKAEKLAEAVEQMMDWFMAINKRNGWGRVEISDANTVLDALEIFRTPARKGAGE